MDTHALRVARDKLVRVFRYLEALNQHRNPAKKQIGDQIWTLWLKNLPDHPSIRRGERRLPERLRVRPERPLRVSRKNKPSF